MLKSEIIRLQHLVKKNAEKAAREERNEIKKKTTRKQEDESVNKDVDANEARKLFQEMKVREF